MVCLSKFDTIPVKYVLVKYRCLTDFLSILGLYNAHYMFWLHEYYFQTISYSFWEVNFGHHEPFFVKGIIFRSIELVIKCYRLHVDFQHTCIMEG